MRYVVLSLLCLIAIIGYVQRTGINSVKQVIAGEIGINTEEFGALGSSWLIGYALMQVPAGWLADRLGSRNVLVVHATLWSLLAGSIGLCHDFRILLLLWFGMGLAQAGIFPCAAKAIGAWFPDTEKAMASGMLGSSTMLGVAAGSMLTVWLVFFLRLSWQWTYVLYGTVGVTWAITYYTMIPERGGAQSATSPPMTRDDWRELFGSVSLWLLCGQQFFRAGAMIFFINWFPIFLRESRGLSELDAGVSAGFVNGAAMTGGIIGGFCSDWLLRRTGMRRLSRQGLAVAGMSTCSLLNLITYFITDNQLAVILFCVGAFVATFGGVSGYTVAIELGGKRIGIVFSMMNMCGNFGGAIVNFAAGSLTERTQSWDPALFVIVGIFIVDAICWALLNPRAPLFEDVQPTREPDHISSQPVTGIRPGEPPARRGDFEEHHETR